MKTRNLVIIGCAGLLVLCVLGAGLVGLFLWHVSQDPKAMEVSVDAPATVKRGEECDLTVAVVNRRAEPLTVTTIDVGESYLEGFTVVGTDPAYKSSVGIPIDNSRSYTFDADIAAGATNVFTFQLRATRKGRYIGDVDTCEGLRFVTHVADTTVE